MCEKCNLLFLVQTYNLFKSFLQQTRGNVLWCAADSPFKRHSICSLFGIALLPQKAFISWMYIQLPLKLDNINQACNLFYPSGDTVIIQFLRDHSGIESTLKPQ